MPFFKKKPVIIEAEQYTGENEHEIILWGGPDCVPAKGHMIIQTLEGNHIASPGDWIIRGVKGELYPCKPDIFELTYDSTDENPLAPKFTGEVAEVKSKSKKASGS
jgi:hypothetical protein